MSAKDKDARIVPEYPPLPYDSPPRPPGSSPNISSSRSCVYRRLRVASALRHGVRRLNTSMQPVAESRPVSTGPASPRAHLRSSVRAAATAIEHTISLSNDIATELFKPDHEVGPAPPFRTSLRSVILASCASAAFLYRPLLPNWAGLNLLLIFIPISVRGLSSVG
jgi:hypothetical protein